FAPESHPDPKETLMRQHAFHIDIVETATEAEALLLEASLIKQHMPRYNKMLKDDKSYPFLKITGEEYPRLIVVRGRKSDGSHYFGPFTSAKLLKQCIALLRRMFPMRTCQPMPKKECLMYHIKQCPAPCIDPSVSGVYQQTVQELKMFLEGKKKALIQQLTKRMDQASKDRDYESARIYRDQIHALTKVASTAVPKHEHATGLLLLQQKIRLNRFPNRIEAFDISNFQGDNPVASMVVFESGKPKRSDYRKFKIKTVKGIDDFEMIKEAVLRRYKRLLEENKPLPDLILIDGGKGQLSHAREALDELNLSDMDLISIAKQHEWIYKPGRSEPYILPADSQALQILRHLRDEAHRFAISFYRSLHRKKMLTSELQNIEGIGPKKTAALLAHFRTFSAIQQASVEDLASVSGIDRKTAIQIAEFFKTH
ncbi:MAG: excinuclease ABC subunit UvrC, partial [Candidatus Omnitrophica bacterium]|nr:excinuclease ABC subunit UvrC [Candidatus Omnitrophota bacterium]